MTKTVIHRDGRIEPFKTEKVIDAIREVLDDVRLQDPFIAMFKIIKNFETKLPDEINTEEIDGLILKAIEPLIAEDPIYDTIATKQFVKIISEDVNKRFQSFSSYISFGVEKWILDPRLKHFDLDRLELELRYEYDNLLNYFGTSTLHHRYLVKDLQKNILEKPQRMWMRIAMWLSILEDNKEDFAVKIYHKLGSLKYLHSTPTLFNSWTNFPQLISCFIGVVGDSLDDIMDKTRESAFYAKFAWWTAMSFTKLRASWSTIASINSASCGPIPFIKIFDTTIASVAIGWKRASNLVAYMEPRHYNIDDFLELKETNGNEAVRARRLNTALWIPDEFMQRVLDRNDWYMFDPKECPELTETRWPAFSSAYAEAIQKAEAGIIKTWKKMPATELYREMLIQMWKTGNYWINFKDRHNEKNQAPSYGNIHSTNMCTEISIPNREDSTATCTLASLNLSKFVKKDLVDRVEQMDLDAKLACIDREDIKETTAIATQALDNVIELNHYVSETSRKSSFDLRPLWLWIMWLGEMLQMLDITYESNDALVLSDKLGDCIYSTALATSTWLVSSRWTFGDYDPSRYSYAPRRNILLLAIAPTASISNIAGTSSGIEPFFSNVYARETLSGKFTIIVRWLVDKLKEHDLWTDEIKQKIMAHQGSIQYIPELDGVINKAAFKTVYECTPLSQIDIAAVWQKYVDQAISRNLYMQEDDRANLYDIYMYAWKQWLKWTYYCFIEKNIQWEKYTETVNKRWTRAGFGASSPNNQSSNQNSAQPLSSSSAPTSWDLLTPTLKRWFGVTVTSTTEASPSLDRSNLDLTSLTETQKHDIERQLRAEKWDEYVDKLKAWTLYWDACPVDPFEKVMCEGCQ
jgi:ribonucleoside-diphosphate reductase alpha chain